MPHFDRCIMLFVLKFVSALFFLCNMFSLFFLFLTYLEYLCVCTPPTTNFKNAIQFNEFIKVVQNRTRYKKERKKTGRTKKKKEKKEENLIQTRYNGKKDISLAYLLFNNNNNNNKYIYDDVDNNNNNNNNNYNYNN
jgi:hypothetical protein